MLKAVIAEVLDAPDADPDRDVEGGPPRQDDREQAARPVGRDPGEPTHRPPPHRVDRGGAGVEGHRGERAVEVDDQEERRPGPDESIERGGDVGRGRDLVGAVPHGVAVTMA